MIEDLRKRLTATPPDLPPWLYVAPNTVQPILRVLEYWSSLKSSKTTQGMLAAHDMDGTRMARRDSIKHILLNNMSEADLKKRGYLPAHISSDRHRAYLEDHLEVIADKIEMEMARKDPSSIEEMWYRHTKVFIPPMELRGRHELLEAALEHYWESGAEGLPQSVRSKVLAYPSCCSRHALSVLRVDHDAYRARMETKRHTLREYDSRRRYISNPRVECPVSSWN